MLDLCLNVKKSLLPLAASLLLFSACSEDGSMEKVDFDRKAMLTHWHDDQITPAFANFKSGVSELQTTAQAFEVAQDSASLIDLQEAFKKSYKLFQHIKFFSFGPNATSSIRANLNTYPTNVSEIESMASGGSFNGGAANQVDAQGFPALDYLLFSPMVDLIASKNHRDVCLANVSYIAQVVNQTSQGWANNRTEFIAADGIDVSSTLGQMVNAVNQDYELIKNAKIGFPAGKRTFGQTFPEAVEGLYSGLSLTLAKENLKAIHQFYMGQKNSGSKQGLSLYDNLIATGVEAEGKLLGNLIDEQFTDAENKLEAIPGSINEAVDKHQSEINQAYSSIQLNVIYLKTDMPSALGVIITYQDNDGD